MDPLESGLCSKRERECLAGQSTVPSGCREKAVPGNPAWAERAENVGGAYPAGSVLFFGALIGEGSRDSSEPCGTGGADPTTRVFSASTDTDATGTRAS